MKKLYFLTCLMLSFTLMFAQEKVDEEINKIIIKQGMDSSQVMEIASWITDVYGPRLTGSPMLDKATEWAQNELKDIKHSLMLMEGLHLLMNLLRALRAGS